jgi:hypothetical protein
MEHLYQTTYSRVMLALSMPAATELFNAYGRPTSRSEAVDLGGGFKVRAPNQAQIDETFLTPHTAFLRHDIAIGAEIIDTQLETVKLRNLHFQQQLLIETVQQQLETKAKASKEDFSKILGTSETELNEQTDVTETSLHQLNTIDSHLKTHTGKINNLINQHDEEFSNFRRKHTELLINEMEKNGIAVQSVANDLLNQHTVAADLLRDYENSRITLPLAIDDIQKKESNYFYVQAWYAIYASLAHGMQIPTDNEIKGKIKSLDKIFTQVDSEFATLTSKQDQERQKLLSEVKVLKEACAHIKSQLHTQQGVTAQIQEQFNLSVPQQRIVDGADELGYQKDQAEAQGAQLKTR